MGKRVQGEGAIYQRKSDGRWCASVDMGIVNGKRRRKVIYGDSREDVAVKLRQLQHKIDQGIDVSSKSVTVAQFLEHWLEKTVKRKNAPRTYESYAERVRLDIVPNIGHIRLDKLSPADVESMLDALEERDLSSQTIAYARSILRIALNHAIKRELLTRNVAAMVDGPRVEPYEAAFLSVEEARRLLIAMQGHRFEMLFRVALSLGLLRGEILSLTWADVDLERQTLRITKSKTKWGRRPLQLPPSLIADLRVHKQRQEEQRQQCGEGWKEHGLVFPSSIGTPINPPNLVREFKRLLVKAGLDRRIRIHDLRHSCASFLLAEKESLRIVMDILRHRNISTTMDIYAHIFPEAQSEAIGKVDKLLSYDDHDNEQPTEGPPSENADE
jgi:integrase